MQDLQITDKSIKVRTGTVVFTDYETIKAEAQELAELIKSTEVSEENVKMAKKMLASLNKSVEDLESRRIAIKKAILTQYNVFEGQIKEIVGIVKDADTVVRQQVRDLEEIERDAKRDEIGKLWDQRIQHYDFRDIVKFEDFLEPQHLNKSVSLKKVEEQMATWLEARRSDIDVIFGSEDAPEIMGEYVQTYNLAVAMKTVRDRHVAEQQLEEIIKENYGEPQQGATPKYIFIISNLKDATLTELLLQQNGINFVKEVR